MPLIPVHIYVLVLLQKILLLATFLTREPFERAEIISIIMDEFLLDRLGD
jgi:hypothetical protein